MFLTSDLKPNKFLYSKAEEVCYCIANVKPGSGYIYLVSFKADGQEISLPEQYSTSAIQRKREDGSLELLDFNPFLKDRDYLDLSEAQLRSISKTSSKVLDVVKNDRFYSNERYQVIKEALLTEPKISEPTLLSAIRKYFYGQMRLEALAARFEKCGAKGKPKSTRKIAQVLVDLIITGFKKYFLNSDLTIEEARLKTIELEWNKEVHGTEYFNYETFRRYGQKSFPHAYANKILRMGIKNAKRNHKLNRGRTNDIAIGPGSLFQIDWCKLDINLVASFNRSLFIGQPKLYCVVDSYSRLLVGLLITKRNPCWDTFMHAIYYAAMDKVKLAAYYGYKLTEGTWLGSCLPQAFIADGEAANLKANSLGQNHHVTLANAESYRGDLKAVVERMHKTIKSRIRPSFVGAGHTNDRYGRRLGVDGRMEACATLQELYHIAFEVAIEYNNLTMENYPNNEDMLEHLVDKTPNAIWLWGEEHGFGYQKTDNEKSLFLDLMKREMIIPNEDGFRIENHQFIPASASDQNVLENLVNLPNGSGELTVIYDSDCFNQKYWFYEGRLIPLRKMGKDEQEYDNIWEMMAVNKYYNNRSQENRQNEDQTKVNTNKNIGKILNGAKDEQARTGDKLKVKDSNDQVKIEIEMEKRSKSDMNPFTENSTTVVSDKEKIQEGDEDDVFSIYLTELEEIDKRKSVVK